MMLRIPATFTFVMITLAMQCTYAQSILQNAHCPVRDAKGKPPI